MDKVLITLHENDIAPRFDLASEVIILSPAQDSSSEQSKTLVLAHPSSEDLCQLVLDEDIEVVICGGIEEEFYDYLSWKGVRVIDSVAGPWSNALDRLQADRLQPGDILYPRPGGADHASP